MSVPLRTSRPRLTRVIVFAGQASAPPVPADCNTPELSAFLADRAAASVAPWDDVVPGCGVTRFRETVQSLD